MAANSKIGFVNIIIRTSQAREISIVLKAKWIAVLWERNSYEQYAPQKIQEIKHTFDSGCHSFTIAVENLKEIYCFTGCDTEVSFSGCPHLSKIYCSPYKLTNIPSTENIRLCL